MNESLKIILGWGVGIVMALIFLRTRFAKDIITTKEEQQKLGVSGLEKALMVISIGCLAVASFIIVGLLTLKWLFWVLMAICVGFGVGFCFVRRRRIKALRK